MIILDFGFPGGRYHATPGGHHVNEGLIEWPPSPWRILRALIATGYTRLGWQEVPETGRRLVESLSRALPSYVLPPASAAHLRHYMPLAKMKDGTEATALVYDSFADLGSGSLQVVWDVDLGPAEQDLLESLVAHLGYLGRSESWVEGRIEVDQTNCSPNAWPAGDEVAPGPGYEQVFVSTPEVAEPFLEWCTARREEARVEPGVAKKKREQQVQRFPVDLCDALQWDTARWKAAGWTQPPGSRRTLYWRRRDALEVGPAPRTRPKRVAPVECMLLSLATPSRSRSALPSVARTLPQAELLHRSLVSKAGQGERTDCPELVGKDADGRPLEGHQHVRILPLDLDGDRKLDHVLLTAKMGLGGQAQDAVRSLRRTWQKSGHDLQVALVGSGELETLRGLPGPLRAGADRLLGPKGGSKVWQTAVPYVAPRFLKKRGKNALEGQLAQELQSLGIDGLAEITLLPWEGPWLHLRHTIIRRGGASSPQPKQAMPLMVRLRFAAPVHGPICLGYASHFGLGRFEAI